MRGVSPFDHRPDRSLGRALREILGPEDHRAFVADVVERARRQFNNPVFVSPWEILGMWMRPGLAAAALLVLATVLSVRNNKRMEYVTIDDELSRGSLSLEASTLLNAPTPPDVDIVLTSAFEN